MPYLMNTWYVAAHAAEVTQKPMSRKILDTPVVMYRDNLGNPHALDNRCPHRFAPLHFGTVDDDQITCAYHGLRFNSQGTCTLNPHGDGRIPPNARVRVFPIVEKYQYLWIWMGDRDLADPVAIPDFSVIDDPEFRFFHSYLSISADYQLITDNLLDLSHIQFLHPFLSTPEWVANSHTTSERVGNTVYGTSRSKVEIPAFPVYRFVKPDVAPTGIHWMDSRWDAPANIYLDIRLVTSPKDVRAPNGHFMTPESDNKTHYFFCVGLNHRTDDEELFATLKAKVCHAFEHEDEPMIVAQQANLGRDELMSLGPVGLQSDRVALSARRVLKHLINAETQGSTVETSPEGEAA